MALQMIKTAAFNASGHRICLERVFDVSKPRAFIIMNSPSTATNTVNDPTVTRLTNTFKANFDQIYGGFVLINIASDDEYHIKKTISSMDSKDILVLAWGNKNHTKNKKKMNNIVESIGQENFPKTYAFRVNTTNSSPGFPRMSLNSLVEYAM